MELLWGGGCLLAFYWVACMVGHGYANTVDSIALFLHDHAENVKRMHSAREAQIRSRWLAGGHDRLEERAADLQNTTLDRGLSRRCRVARDYRGQHGKVADGLAKCRVIQVRDPHRQRSSATGAHLERG